MAQDYATGGLEALSETREALRRTLIELFQRQRGAGSAKFDAPCSQWVTEAQQHSDAAAAALAAGDLKTCAAELEAGFSAVAEGEVCILLQELLMNKREGGGPMAEATYEPKGSGPLAEIESELRRTLIELFQRERGAGSAKFDAPCSQWVTEAQQHSDAAAAALAAGDLKTCAAELEAGFSAVVAGEVCIFLKENPPL